MKATIKRVDESQEYFFREGCHILELHNDVDDPDSSIARARVAPGVTTAAHRLQGTTERYLILEGQGRVEVGDLPPDDVRPGSVICIPPHTSQRITNTGSGDLIFLAICTPRFETRAYEAL